MTLPKGMNPRSNDCKVDALTTQTQYAPRLYSSAIDALSSPSKTSHSSLPKTLQASTLVHS